MVNLLEKLNYTRTTLIQGKDTEDREEGKGMSFNSLSLAHDKQFLHRLFYLKIKVRSAKRIARLEKLIYSEDRRKLPTFDLPISIINRNLRNIFEILRNHRHIKSLTSNSFEIIRFAISEKLNFRVLERQNVNSSVNA